VEQHVGVCRSEVALPRARAREHVRAFAHESSANQEQSRGTGTPGDFDRPPLFIVDVGHLPASLLDKKLRQT
jgi:hypothetical protein